MKLIIVDTATSKPQIFENITASTFGELKTATKYDFNNKAVVERESRNSLDIDDAKLPNVDELVLYVTQKRVKAGSGIDDMSRTELMARAKEIKESSDEGNEHIGNYTTKSSAVLRSLLTEWEANNSDVSTNEEFEAQKAGLIAKIDGIISMADEAKEMVAGLTAAQGACPTFDDLKLQQIIEDGASIRAALKA